MSPSEFVQQLVNALSLGSIYALLALGLSMVYGVLGMLNWRPVGRDGVTEPGPTFTRYTSTRW
jgi:ABC-type branched-subunit amino acid transport system permease subunit